MEMDLSSGIVLDYEPAVSRLAGRLKMAEADVLRLVAELARRLSKPA
jgi:hypothetical protein